MCAKSFIESRCPYPSLLKLDPTLCSPSSGCSAQTAFRRVSWRHYFGSHSLKRGVEGQNIAYADHGHGARHSNKFRFFKFHRVGEYLDALLPWVITPLLVSIIHFFNRPPDPNPHLLQFMDTAENLRFRVDTVLFGIPG
jgi:hypothetical protein